MRSSFEPTIKRQQWPRELEAIACQFKLLSRMNVRHQELKRGTIWTLAKPKVQILLFMLLEENQIVARQIIAEISDYFFCFFAIDFGLLLRVGQQVLQVLH